MEDEESKTEDQFALEGIVEDEDEAPIDKNVTAEPEGHTGNTKWNLILQHLNRRESRYQNALSEFQESHDRARKSLTETRRQSSAIGFIPTPIAVPSIVVNNIMSTSDEDLTEVGLNPTKSFAALLSMKDSESVNYFHDPATVINHLNQL
jgi:hypothetical protein